MTQGSPPKCAVTVHLDAALLDETCRLRIELSQVLDGCLRKTVQAEQRWPEANKAALEAYNRRVARDGLLTDDASLL